MHLLMEREDRLCVLVVLCVVHFSLVEILSPSFLCVAADLWGEERDQILQREMQRKETKESKEGRREEGLSVFGDFSHFSSSLGLGSSLTLVEDHLIIHLMPWRSFFELD
ncbi:hypothetical protein Dimus_038724 [Dionaea muscipula]